MTLTRSLLASVSLLCLLSPAAQAQTAAPAKPAAPAAASLASAPVTRQELHDAVKDVLLNDPDIISQAIQKLREKQAVDAQQQSKAALAKHKDALYNDAGAPTVGPASADVTIVEFFDYHCGYCRQMLPAITKLLSEDKGVRFIFKEFPILSEDSTNASRAALAVNSIAKDKYFDYHQALMKHEGRFDEKSLLDVAKKLGIDTKKLKAEMDKKEISDVLDKDRAIGEDLGVRGTPALIVGDEIVSGALAYEDLKKMVDNARAVAKATKPAVAPEAAPAPKAAEPAPAPAAPKAEAPAAPKVETPAAPKADAPAGSTAPAIPTPPAPAKN